MIKIAISNDLRAKKTKPIFNDRRQNPEVRKQNEEQFFINFQSCSASTRSAMASAGELTSNKALHFNRKSVIFHSFRF